MSNKKQIIVDQEKFFNLNSARKRSFKQTIFSEYANKEQIKSLKWITDCKIILEYGCGTGTSLDVFLKNRKINKYQIYGVDIAQLVINKAKENYPQYNFYKISNNKIPQIKNNSLDAVFMFHVLHHADKHKDIFKEIHKKLKKDGKFLINDLSSNNPINKTARSLFVHMPLFVKNKFSDDLVVGESIPEKNKVSPQNVITQLKKAGFSIQEVGYGHLFFFIFAWLDKFVHLSGISFVENIYKQIIKIENTLLRYQFFQKYTEVFYIKCYKE